MNKEIRNHSNTLLQANSSSWQGYFKIGCTFPGFVRSINKSPPHKPVERVEKLTLTNNYYTGRTFLSLGQHHHHFILFHCPFTLLMGFSSCTSNAAANNWWQNAIKLWTILLLATARPLRKSQHTFCIIDSDRTEWHNDKPLGDVPVLHDDSITKSPSKRPHYK